MIKPGRTNAPGRVAASSCKNLSYAEFGIRVFSVAPDNAEQSEAIPQNIWDRLFPVF
jgi:hypothetical protein